MPAFFTTGHALYAWRSEIREAMGMRDIAARLFEDLCAEPESADGTGEDRWRGLSGHRAPAGDWCQTAPGQDAIGWLASLLSAGGGPRERRRH